MINLIRAVPYMVLALLLITCQDDTSSPPPQIATVEIISDAGEPPEETTKENNSEKTEETTKGPQTKPETRKPHEVCNDCNGKKPNPEFQHLIKLKNGQCNCEEYFDAIWDAKIKAESEKAKELQEQRDKDQKEWDKIQSETKRWWNAQDRLIDSLLTNDPVYSKIDLDDPISYVDAFILDANRHGLKLDPIPHENITFELKGFERDGDYYPGFARGICNPKVHIGVAKKIDNEPPFEDEYIFGTASGFMIFWHELGHDILNLDHTCANPNIMNNVADLEWEGKPCIDWDQSITYGGQLGVTPIDSLIANYIPDYKKAIERMFTGEEQVFYDCK